MKAGYTTKAKTAGMKMMEWTLSSPGIYHIAGKAGRMVMKYAPFAVNNSFNPWYKQRDMPSPPAESFDEWYKKYRGK